MTRVEFTNQKGKRLVGHLHGTLESCAVISCHGMFSNKDGEKHVLLGKILERSNIPLLRFDFEGCGGSEGSLFDLSYSSRIEDLNAAISYLATQGVERFALFGSSMGGSIALLAAARDERIVAIATLAAIAHVSAFLERHPEAILSWETLGVFQSPYGPISEEFYNDAKTHDVLSAATIIRAPVLVLHSVDDAVVPVMDAHDIASALRNVSLDIVDHAGHTFDHPTYLRPTMLQVADFLKNHLAFFIL